MTLRRRFHLKWPLAATALLVPLALAQPEPNQPGAAPTGQAADEDQPLFRFEITPRMLYNGLDKLVEKRLAKDYDLDEYQKEEMRRVLHEHVPRFLKEHQAELQQIWVEWVEAISADEPPDPEYVAGWARRLLPIVEDAQGMVDGVSEEMRGFLDDRQEVLLDGYLAACDVGSQFLTNRLREFEAGGFDPRRDWPGYKEVRQRDPEGVRRIVAQAEAERQIAMAGSAQEHAAPRTHRPGAPHAGPSASTPGGDALAGDVRTAAPASRPAQGKDEWDLYVEGFIRRYKLDDEQTQRANRFLTQQKTRRESYFARKVGDMETLKRMYEEARGDPQKTALAESRHQRLYKPVDRMFEQLKGQLDKLPTRAQRKAAAELDAKEARRPGAAIRHDAGQP